MHGRFTNPARYGETRRVARREARSGTGRRRAVGRRESRLYRLR